MKKTLTIREANRLARGRARVTASPVDRRLWQVEGDGWVEAHEPMTRLEWQTFLAQKVDAETAEQHKSVAYSGDAAEVLKDVLRDNLSPRAVAAIVAYLQPARTKDKAVNHELEWFAERLTELVGGPEMQGRLAEEVGL
jgi:glutamine cyclotransferase